jgi:hypothetical protein
MIIIAGVISNSEYQLSEIALATGFPPDFLTAVALFRAVVAVDIFPPSLWR